MTSPSSTAMNQLAAGCCCREGAEEEAEEKEKRRRRRRRLEEQERGSEEQTPPTDRSASSAAAATPLGVASPLEKARWYSATLRRLGEVSGSAEVEATGEAAAPLAAPAAPAPPGKRGAAACALRAGPIPPSPTALSPAQPSTGEEPTAPVSIGHSGDQHGASGALASRSARGMPYFRNCAALRQESQGCSAIQATRGMMGPARRGTLLSFAVVVRLEVVVVVGGGSVREREPERRGRRLFFGPTSIAQSRFRMKLKLFFLSLPRALSLSPFYALHRSDLVGIVIRYIQRRGQLAHL